MRKERVEELRMTDAAHAVLAKALQLSPVERAQLINELYRSFEGIRPDAVISKWAQEVESRIDAYEAGHIAADSAEAVFSRINKR